LLQSEPVDIVAVCSPAESHLAQLELAVKAGCHVFSEKPLWWSDQLTRCENPVREVREPTQRLLELFLRQRRYLALNTQWPFTLEAFRQLHPQAGVGD
ncbi:MAG: Gfo/Idh/MocA family oxidoreductase, partial [Acidiferrobacterales bacterium]|nr:Gfo/Idh/MocA family oxidoreductase [Acidiferrobacterales bacterium]